MTANKKVDMVNHPPHYTEHPSGIECIQITRRMPFSIGNATKYVWRADLKNGLEDWKKALWYCMDELANCKPLTIKMSDGLMLHMFKVVENEPDAQKVKILVFLFTFPVDLFKRSSQRESNQVVADKQWIRVLSPGC